MEKRLLVTRPCYDDATSYCFYYAGLMVKEAGKKGIGVFDLKRPRLTKENLTEIIKDKCPEFLFFNAHGDEKTIYGDKTNGQEEVLVKENVNHELLDFKLVYARACSAAASLGKACKGGCFIGYSAPFSFWIDERWSTNPANDKTAKIFFEPSNIIVGGLLKGSTAQEAVEKSLNLSKKKIMELLKDKEEPGALASVMVLWNNMESTEIAGNRQMRFR